MKPTTLLTTSILLLTTAYATPTVYINATNAGIGNNPPSTSQILSAQLYQLNTYPNLGVTQLAIGTTQDIPAADVECRMYKDTAGLQPGSAPWSGSQAALISTNTVQVGSIVCYAIADISSYVN
jgi:hypothetical protein